MTIISYDVNGDLKKVDWIKDYLTVILFNNWQKSMVLANK